MNNLHFAIHMLTLPSTTIVHTRFNDNWLFVSFFYYCHYYLGLVFFYLVLFFILWLYNDLLNFSFCKYMSSHPTNICSKLVLLPGTLLLLTISILVVNFFEQIFAGWDPTYDTKHLTCLGIVDFTFKTCIRAFF